MPAVDETKIDRQLKRQALQLAAMLPDDPEAARQVLDYAIELVEDFVKPKRRTCRVPLDTKGTGGPLRLVTLD